MPNADAEKISEYLRTTLKNKAGVWRQERHPAWDINLISFLLNLFIYGFSTP